MDRRRLVLGSATMALAAPFGRARAETAGDPVAFVRDLYTREIARHNSRGKMSQDEFLALFTRQTREVWLAARGSTVPIPAGPILNAFFGWGVLPGQNIALQSVSPVLSASGMLSVAVALSVRGERRRVYVHPVRENGAWRIANMAYDRGEDFLAYHRRLGGR